VATDIFLPDIATFKQNINYQGIIFLQTKIIIRLLKYSPIFKLFVLFIHTY